MIFIASDHGGYDLKNELKAYLAERGLKTEDLGVAGPDPVDYPDFAVALARRVVSGNGGLGVLVCGTGIGMSIAANKVPGIRAALVHNEFTARMAKEHNDANVLVMGGRVLTPEEGKKLLGVWLDATFAGDRHKKRLDKIEGMDTASIGMKALKDSDPEVHASVVGEIRREEESIVLIASENYASQAVMEAQGSVFTNKYAEGYPGARYYGGCKYSDEVETLAIERAKKLFGAEHANVQPISGSAANMAAYYALINPGDKIVSMALAHGGHLTHGAPVSFSGRLYNVVSYGVEKETGRINYDKVADIVAAEKPRALVAGASSYSRVLDFPRLREIADSVGAYFIMDMAHIAGLVAGGAHPNPVPYADIVTSTTHKTLRGPRGGLVLCRAEFAKAVDKAVFPGLQGGPLVHTIAAKAVAFGEAMKPEFSVYARRITENASAMAEAFKARGFPVVSGGTENHLFMLDLSGKDITGVEAEKALDRAGITVNKNSIPYDMKSPTVTSGIRIGTPIVTTRGMGTGEMVKIVELMISVLENPANEELALRVKAEVAALCARFPFYAGLAGT